LKIVESLSMGTPVVSTTIGAQGLGIFHNEDALLADTPGAFVQQVVRGLKDETLREGLVRRGKATVTARLSWEGLSARLRSVYAKQLPGSPKTQRVKGESLPQRPRQLAEL
jgi:polysaccharide biosynthesis protein PslH